MYYFSKQFIDGLKTKSENFQNKFHEIVDDICDYAKTAEEKREIQKIIEANHTYDTPGNMLYSSQVFFCGEHPDIEKLKEKINFHLLGLFDSFEAEDSMIETTHIIICISSSNKDLSDEDMNFFKALINFERVCRGVLPALVTTVYNCTDDIGASCYVACLK